MQRFKFHFCQHGAARATTTTTTTPTLVSRKAFKPAQKSIKRTKQQPPSHFPSLPHSASPSQFLQTQPRLSWSRTQRLPLLWLLLSLPLPLLLRAVKVVWQVDVAVVLLIVVWRLSTPWRRPVAATPTAAAAAAAVYLQTLRTRDPIWQHPSNSPLLPLPFAIHAGRHHNATASSKKLGSAMSHSARQNHLKRPAIITYDRPTDEDCQLARYIVYIRLPRYCCLFPLQYRERDERDCSIQNTKYPFYLHISWGLSSSSTYARNGEKFHFLIYLFSLPTTRQEICRFFVGGSGLCLCVKVCTRDKTTAILSSYIFSRARFRHSGVLTCIN